MHANLDKMTYLGNFPYFSFMIATLVIIATLLFLIPKMAEFAKQIALVTASVIMVETIYLTSIFDFTKADTVQFSEIYQWIPHLGVTWSFGVNSFALIMILGATILTTLVIISNWNNIGVTVESKLAEKNYLALILLLEAFIILIFATRDLFVFYLAFEAMLIPAYFMISRHGIGKNKEKAAIKFILYSLFGGLVMLVGVVIVFVYAVKAPFTFHLDFLTHNLNLPFSMEAVAFITFFIAFAIKAPMAPLHTWLTTTTENAHPSTSVLLVGVLDKIGTFGMLNFALPLFPNAVKFFSVYIVVWALISVFYGAFLAVWEKNFLRLVSLTSVSHFGFIIIGIHIGSTTALTGALMYMVAHMVSIAALFLIVGYLGQRTGTFEILEMKGMQRKTPVLAGCFLIAGLATVALPGLSGFVPEYLVLMGTYQVWPVLAGISVLAVIISAVYILLPYQRVFAGKPCDGLEVKDFCLREKFVSGVLIILMFLLGFFPNILLDGFSQISSTVEKSAKVLQVDKKADGSGENINKIIENNGGNN